MMADASTSSSSSRPLVSPCTHLSSLPLRTRGTGACCPSHPCRHLRRGCCEENTQKVSGKELRHDPFPAQFFPSWELSLFTTTLSVHPRPLSRTLVFCFRFWSILIAQNRIFIFVLSNCLWNIKNIYIWFVYLLLSALERSSVAIDGILIKLP